MTLGYAPEFFGGTSVVEIGMARLRRRWRMLKWAGLVLSLLLVAGWAVSLQRNTWCWVGTSDKSVVFARLWDGPLLITVSP